VASMTIHSRLMSAGLGLNVRVTEGLLSVEVFVNPAPVCVPLR